MIAMDLIGHGQSGKPDIDYRLADHAAYFEAFMDELALEDVTLVLQDWGGGVGIDYAMSHEDNVRGIAFFNAITTPEEWHDLRRPIYNLYAELRDSESGPELIQEENIFIETLLPAFSGRPLSEAELDAYRVGFETPADRAPILSWVREIPIDGDPADVQARLADNYSALQASDVPLLLSLIHI